MADPFDVAPPQWLTNLVGRPVDMGAVGTAVGGALSRRFNPPTQMDRFQALTRARMESQIEQIKSHTAEETANAQLKTHLLQQKTQADLQTSEWLAQNSGNHETILSAEIPARYNSIAVDNIWKLKNQASLFGNRLQNTKYETGLNTALMTASAKNTDQNTARRISTLRATVGKNGWLPQYQEELDSIVADVNRSAVSSKLDYQQNLSNLKLASQKEMAGIRQDNALDRLWQKHQDQLEAIDINDSNAVARLNQGFKNSLELLKQKQAGVEVVETYKGQEAQAAKTHMFSPNEPATPEIPGRRVKKTVAAGEAISSAIDVELNLAKDAIKAGVSLDKVAKRYKERTGQDFPTQ